MYLDFEYNTAIKAQKVQRILRNKHGIDQSFVGFYATNFCFKVNCQNYNTTPKQPNTIKPKLVLT